MRISDWSSDVCSSDLRAVDAPPLTPKLSGKRKRENGSMRFAGKIAVVTGAASGIGKATVLKLAGEGAHVFAADIDEAGGRALAEQSNGKISFVRCDVTLPADIEALMDAAAAKAGGIDIVFNNAAAGGA